MSDFNNAHRTMSSGSLRTGVESSDGDQNLSRIPTHQEHQEDGFLSNRDSLGGMDVGQLGKKSYDPYMVVFGSDDPDNPKVRYDH